MYIQVQVHVFSNSNIVVYSVYTYVHVHVPAHLQRGIWGRAYVFLSVTHTAQERTTYLVAVERLLYPV